MTGLEKYQEAIKDKPLSETEKGLLRSLSNAGREIERLREQLRRVREAVHDYRKHDDRSALFEEVDTLTDGY